jgi:NAD(P)-dependent dehydrogenase (short-subunit alcohol dehydrogenase family)
MKLGTHVSAVVTGGGSGLGEATAKALAQAGVKVSIFDIDERRGGVVADSIGGIFCHVDVTSDEGVDAAFLRARKAHGQESILVNCAGILAYAKTVSRGKNGEISHFPLDVFERIIQVNLIGTFRCIAKSAAGMTSLVPKEDGERGAIINTASVAAVDGQIGQTAYSASKGGLIGLNLPAARDLAAEGIRINTIMPGIMETAMVAGLPENIRAEMVAKIPFPKRLGRPEEFASLVLELCRNSYLNGETIRLDGALRMQAR